MAINLCAVVGGNTGGAACSGKRGTPKMFVAGSKEFTSSDYADEATFLAAVQTAVKLPNGNANKLFVFPEIGEVEDISEEDTTGSLALGPLKVLRKGRRAYRYRAEVSNDVFKKLLAFHNQVVPIFTYDDSFQWWGYRAAPAAYTLNTNNFKGESARIAISGNGFGNGNDATTGTVVISVFYQSTDNFEQRSAYIYTPTFATGDLVPLIDVIMSEPSAHVSNVHKIRFDILSSNINADLNIYDTYGAALAALVANFSAGTGTGYATALTITSIAVDATNKCLTVTFDSTAYTALAGGAKIKFNPPTPAQLAATVPGIEIGYIILTK